jgi:hypothetical protein
MRELLQPAARELQIAELKQNRAPSTVSADLRERIKEPAAAQPLPHQPISWRLWCSAHG